MLSLYAGKVRVSESAQRSSPAPTETNRNKTPLSKKYANLIAKARDEIRVSTKNFDETFRGDRRLQVPALQKVKLEKMRDMPERTPL